MVKELVLRARKAQSLYDEYSQDAVDKVVLGVAWAVLSPNNNDCLNCQLSALA